MKKAFNVSRKHALLILCALFGCFALRSPTSRIQYGLKLSSTAEHNQNDLIEELISSNEIQNVFALLLRNPTIFPSPTQSVLLLNNLDILAKISSGNDVSKFYNRLQKGGKAIPSYGAMILDGPLSEINLPKFEMLMTVDPTILQKATEIDGSAYESLLIPNELGVMSSARRSSLEIRVKLQVALLFAFLDFGCQLQVTGDSSKALTNVAITFAIAAGLAVLESPPLLNGEISRRLGWLKSSVGQMLSANEKQKVYRSNAATFLLSYLLGSPIQEFDLDPNSPTAVSKFRYPDAPRIDLRDPAMSVLEQNGQLDLNGLKRLSTIHMTASAMDAFDGTGTPKIASYAKVLLAALGQRAANPLYSTISGDEFPSRLLPTLARWGFVEATLVIRENIAAIDALVEVFKSGGGVGDAIAAIEGTVTSAPDSAFMIRRQKRLQVESEILIQDSSTFNAIDAINNAKALATPAQDALDIGPIEYIKGTSRIYTREELVLPINPSPSQVKVLAREIMNDKLQADKLQHGKVTERTTKEIAALYQQISSCLRIYETSEEAKMGIAKDFESPLPTAGGDKISETLRDSQSYLRTLMSNEEKEGLLHQVGLSEQKLLPLKALPLFMQDLDFIGETLIQLNKLQESYWNNFYNIEALWVFRGSVYFERFTGLAAMNAVDSVWDATGLTTRVTKTKGDGNLKGLGGGKINMKTIQELNDLVGRLKSAPPSGDGKVPDGSKDKSNGAYLNANELKTVTMIPVVSDDFSLISRDDLDRSHEQRRKALRAARNLPYLTELLVEGNDVDDSSEDDVSIESESVSATNADEPADDDIDSIEDEEEQTTPHSPVNMMIHGNIGESYKNLEVSVQNIVKKDGKILKRISQLENMLK